MGQDYELSFGCVDLEIIWDIQAGMSSTQLHSAI